MLLSLFTPTHRPIYLQEAYATLLHQSGNIPFEWVIVPNNGIGPDDIPAQIRADSRVRVIPPATEINGIGALKRFACEQCNGDVFVEFDHDDTLAPNALEELAKAAEATPDGFYYSDFINIKTDGTCETFNRLYGWQLYNAVIDGKPYVAIRAFEPSARSMCQIFFCPNHVRAWSRVAYGLAGEHDPELFVGDDHDLICRTYIAGVPFVHIPQPLYIYRCTDNQSFREHNEKVQIQQKENCDKYMHRLIYAEHLRNGKLALDFGKKEWCPPEFQSYDLLDNKLQPCRTLEDNSISVIRAVDCLQKIPTEWIVPTMNEIYRLLVPGGWFISTTPSIDDGFGHMGRGAFQDPTNCSYWSENNFDYFCKKKFAVLLKDYTGRFQEVRKFTAFPTEWHKQKFIPYVSADLSALKDQRQPGLSDI